MTVLVLESGLWTKSFMIIVINVVVYVVARLYSEKIKTQLYFISR